MKKYTFLLVLIVITHCCLAQNVGVGTTTPEAKLHIKGSADIPQLIIQANAVQSNTQPLVRFRNVAGQDIMHVHSDTEYNVFMGINAGRVNNAKAGFGGGLYNTFIGSNTGYYNTTGQMNTAMGRGAFFQNTFGSYNTTIGFRSMFSNIDGTRNAAVGYEALLSNISGRDNTAIGTNALRLNTIGARNTAVGTYALESQSFNNGLAFISTENTAVGFSALGLNQPTTATNGSFNTALGSFALYFNTTGTSNTAVGAGALGRMTDGTDNIAIGRNSLANSSTGYSNVVVGTNAGVDNTGGTYTNTVIGANAHILGNNSTVVGSSAYTNTNNLALLGSASTTIVGGYANWTNFSDGRFKTGLNEDVKGLDFILRLRPVTYHMNLRALYKHWGISLYPQESESITTAVKASVNESIRIKEGIRMSGFVAQEVEKAARLSGYDFDGVVKPAHDKDHYRLAYGEFVVPLVKAVQEQQQIIEDKQKQIDGLRERLEKLERLIMKTATDLPGAK